MSRCSRDEVITTTGTARVRGSSLTAFSTSRPLTLGSFKIEQDDLGRAIRGALGVGPAAEEEIQRLFAVADHVNLVRQLVLPQRDQRQLHVVRVVLDQQEFHFFVVHIAICFCSACAACSRPATVK